MFRPETMPRCAISRFEREVFTGHLNGQPRLRMQYGWTLFRRRSIAPRSPRTDCAEFHVWPSPANLHRKNPAEPLEELIEENFAKTAAR
jgi:hypothetical protein